MMEQITKRWTPHLAKRQIRHYWIQAWGNGLLIAMLLLAGWSGAHAETTTYYVTNAQGTVVATIDSKGNVTYVAAYRPYGKQVKGTSQPGPGYTGHVNDPDTRLVYMQQRYYDPDIGRFISPDPVMPTPGNIYNFNRYAYANDNPLRYIDPTGKNSSRNQPNPIINWICDHNVECKRARQQARENKWIRAFGGSVVNFVKHSSRPVYKAFKYSHIRYVCETGATCSAAYDTYLFNTGQISKDELRNGRLARAEGGAAGLGVVAVGVGVYYAVPIASPLIVKYGPRLIFKGCVIAGFCTGKRASGLCSGY